MIEENKIVAYIIKCFHAIMCALGIHKFSEEGIGDYGLQWKDCRCGWWFELKGDWYKFRGRV